MKKKLTASIAVTLVLAVGVFAFAWLDRDSVQASASNEAEERMQEEIAELRALIQALLGMIAWDYAEQPAQVGIPQMSSQAAMNIAVEHLGFGIAEEVELLEIDDVLVFAVDVANGAIRYLVHVNAMNGDVINFNTNDAVPAVIPTQLITPSPSPQPTSSPAPRATSSPASSSPRR